MPRDPVKNRANTARSRASRQERIKAVMADFHRYMKYTPLMDASGETKGYAVSFEFPPEAQVRWEALAKEHNRTPKQMLDEAMEIFVQESQRLRDERN